MTSSFVNVCYKHSFKQLDSVIQNQSTSRLQFKFDTQRERGKNIEVGTEVKGEYERSTDMELELNIIKV